MNANTLKTLVIIPTYNEIESLPTLLADLHQSLPQLEVLVVDDGSPDGTGEWVRKQQESSQWLHLLARTKKSGLGSAYITGFTWGLAKSYDLLVEMDADGSHQVHELAPLLAAVGTDVADLAIGSRWVKGGSVRNWPRNREFLSRGANRYVKLMLGIPVRDATAGFRVYSRGLLQEIPLSEIASQGYCFQVDMTWRSYQRNARILEVPIEFVERKAGRSKMDGKIIREALWKVTAWGVAHRWQQLIRPFSRAK